MLIGRRSSYKDEEIMDRRGFLRLGALLPFYKKVIKELIENKAPEPLEEMTIDWRDSYAKSLTDDYYGLNDPVFVPSGDRIGEYDIVSHSDFVGFSDDMPEDYFAGPYGQPHLAVTKMYVATNDGRWLATRDGGCVWTAVENEQHAKDFLNL